MLLPTAGIGNRNGQEPQQSKGIKYQKAHQQSPLKTTSPTSTVLEAESGGEWSVWERGLWWSMCNEKPRLMYDKSSFVVPCFGFFFTRGPSSQESMQGTPCRFFLFFCRFFCRFFLTFYWLVEEFRWHAAKRIAIKLIFTRKQFPQIEGGKCLENS